jgi:hypothetical protein
MALIGFAQLDTNNKNFFDTTSAQGDLGWSSGQVMGVYKLCRCNFKGKTQGLENTNIRMKFFKRFHLLNSRLFGWGSFYEQNKQQNVLQKGLNNYNTT